MFLMFQLRRPDVLAVGDLGIRRAMMVRYGLPAATPPGCDGGDRRAWRPYRTLACLIPVALAERHADLTTRS